MRVPYTIFAVVCLTALAAPAALAQFGLYGSPEMVNLPESSPAAVPQTQYVAPPTYSGTPPPYWSDPPAFPAPQTAPYASQATYPGGPFAQAPGGFVPPKSPPVAAPPSVPRPLGAERAPSPSPSDPPSKPTSVVDQMLDEAGRLPDYGPAGCGGATCEPTVTEGCTGPGCGQSCRAWYFSMTGLVMDRDRPNRVWTSYEDGNESNQLTNFQDIEFEWQGGGEIRFGRRFGCNQWAIEAVYWMLDPFEGELRTTHGSGLGTSLWFDNVFFNDGGGDQDADDWFGNGAAEHLISRYNEYHNVEFNLLHFPVTFGGCAPWDFATLLGVRYFRFEEAILFGSSQDGAWDGGTNEAYLRDRVENNFIGVQIGCDAGCRFAPKWRLYASPRFGIYNNHVRNRFELFLGNGTGGTQDAYDGEYPVNTSKDAVALLTQLDLGLQWEFWRNWRARIGYRVLVVTGVGLADNQIPQSIANVPEIRDIDLNGELVLHGGFAGVEWCF